MSESHQQERETQDVRDGKGGSYLDGRWSKRMNAASCLSRIRTKLGVSSEDWKEKDSKRKRNEDLVKNRKKEDARKSEKDGASDFPLDSVWYFNAHFGRLIRQLEKVPFPN